MRGRKNLALIIMSLLLAFVLIMPAFASNASEKTEVKKISIKVNQDSKGNVTSVAPREEGYTVSYATNEADAGDNPKVYVVVTAKSGYVFWKDFDRSSHFSISGGKFEEGERISETTVNVEISCKTKVHDTLEIPTDLTWSEDWGLATWEDVDGADYYKVKVNGTEIGNVYQNYIDLSSYIKYKKKNTFQVKAYSNSSYTKASSWSEKSEELYFDDWDEWNDRYDNYDYNDYNYNYSGISSQPGGYYGGTNNSGVKNNWIKRDGIWYYYDGNGYTLKNGMYRIGSKYYIFDSEGRMKTGWQKNNGNYYYFDEVNGDAVSGWKMINGKWNYFKEGKRVEKDYIYENGKTYYVVMDMLSNDWHDGRYFKNGQAYNGRQYNGEMLTNTWDYIKGNWYYFDNNGYAVKNGVAQINGSTYKFAGDGKLLTGGWFDYNGASYYTKPDGTMARNEWINGYYVDGNGRWIR